MSNPWWSWTLILFSRLLRKISSWGKSCSKRSPASQICQKKVFHDFDIQFSKIILKRCCFPQMSAEHEFQTDCVHSTRINSTKRPYTEWRLWRRPLPFLVTFCSGVAVQKPSHKRDDFSWEDADEVGCMCRMFFLFEDWWKNSAEKLNRFLTFSDHRFPTKFGRKSCHSSLHRFAWATTSQIEWLCWRRPGLPLVQLWGFPRFSSRNHAKSSWKSSLFQDENAKFRAALAGAVGGPKSLLFIADGEHQQFPGADMLRSSKSMCFQNLTIERINQMD